MKTSTAEENGDLFTFGWGEWGQLGDGVPDSDKPIEAQTPKMLASLLGNCPRHPKSTWLLTFPFLGKGVNHAALGWSHSAVLTEVEYCVIRPWEILKLIVFLFQTGELLQFGNAVGTHLETDMFSPTPIKMTTR